LGQPAGQLDLAAKAARKARFLAKARASHEARQQELRADFSVTLGSSRYYYNIQIVAINKPSAKGDAQSTLTEAATAKARKYSTLGEFFRPIIISARGLMEKSTAQTYKTLQKALDPVAAAWLDTLIGVTLAKNRASSAASIAKAKPSQQATWQATRATLRARSKPRN
ncbi:hypothetical protein QQS21_012953, partial [Conoideocrella luteorostrata]